MIRLRFLLDLSGAAKDSGPDLVRRPLRISESLDPEADKFARDPRAFHRRQVRICGTCDRERERSRLREGREEEGRGGGGGGGGAGAGARNKATLAAVTGKGGTSTLFRSQKAE